MFFRFICILFVLVGGFGFLATETAYANEDKSLNDIRFEEENWDPRLKQILTGKVQMVFEVDQFQIQEPPANDSKVTQDELVYLEKLAETERTEDQLALIKNEYDGFVFAAFVNAGLLGYEGNEDLMAVVDTADKQMLYATLYFKHKFMRARPTQLDANIKTPMPVPGHPAYPSGHAGQSYLVALILSYVDPDHAEAYEQMAMDIGHRREIAGFHYPSDSDAGRELAKQVFAKFLEYDAFKAELDRIGQRFQHKV